MSLFFFYFPLLRFKQVSSRDKYTTIQDFDISAQSRNLDFFAITWSINVRLTEHIDPRELKQKSVQ